MKQVFDEEFKQSAAYQKHIKLFIEKDKQQKAENRRNWFKNNWINLTTLIVAVFTLLATIILGLLQLLN